MAARQSTPTSEHSHSDSNVRKRVCKACDRCRLKKSKVCKNRKDEQSSPTYTDPDSVTDPALVPVVGQIMPSVSLESARRRMTKCTRRGKLQSYIHNPKESH